MKEARYFFVPKAVHMPCGFYVCRLEMNYS